MRDLRLEESSQADKLEERALGRIDVEAIVDQDSEDVGRRRMEG